MANILVLGAGGMAGHAISLHLIERGHAVTTFSRQAFPFGKNIVGNAEDFSFLKEVLWSDDFDAVVNAIGVLIEESEQNRARAVLLNSYLPHFAVEVLKEKKAKFIQLSTDCVFAGNTGPYRENSLPDGRMFYDRTKALGEINDDRNLTFRNSIVGPDMKPTGVGLFNWFMRQKEKVRGFTRAIWTGVTTITVAKAIEKALTDHLCGIYHLVNNTSISKHDLLVLFNRHLRGDKIAVIPDSSVEIDKSLVNTRTDFSFQVPSYEEMVKEMAQWISCHQDRYPHYQAS